MKKPAALTGIYNKDIGNYFYFFITFRKTRYKSYCFLDIYVTRTCQPLRIISRAVLALIVKTVPSTDGQCLHIAMLHKVYQVLYIYKKLLPRIKSS